MNYRLMKHCETPTQDENAHTSSEQEDHVVLQEVTQLTRTALDTTHTVKPKSRDINSTGLDVEDDVQ
jgi:hypothetical protein